MESQIEALLSEMTLEEKVSLLAGADMWHTVPVERLGIPVLKVTDGPSGARGADGNLGPTSAYFPCGTALAATWNTDLVGRVAAALGDEVRSKGAHILLAPTVNIHRSPLAGRNFECYSEDPYLTGRMATAYINGLQSRGVGACIKHFACNDSEFERMSMSSQVAERPLREIYLRPFEMAIRAARPWAVMSSYNRVNGTYANENAYLLRDILKGEWGFDGIVMSDWYGTYSTACTANGLDLEMPGPARFMAAALEQVKAGTLSEAVVDDQVRRLLRTFERAGLLAGRSSWQPSESCQLSERADDRPEARRVIREAAGEGIVLLKNANGLLPLEARGVKTIAVIGENAAWAQIGGGGSSHVNPHYVVSPLQGITARAGKAARVEYALGCPIHMMTPPCPPEWLTGADVVQHGLTLEMFPNHDLAGAPVYTGVTGRMSLNWWGHADRLVDLDNFSVRLSGTLTPPESGAYRLSLASVGPARLILDGGTLLEHKADGEMGAPWAPAELIAEVTLTAGRAYPITIEYAPPAGLRGRSIHFGCVPAAPADPIAEAAALAARADVAILVAGLTNEWESEGFDRPSMALPGSQDALIARVAAANPNTVVVINAGSPVDMPWLDQVAAVLQTWYGGQESGNALADVLFGDVNPSGKLPTTLPRRLQDTPAYINYPGENGQVLYGEGLFVGYRYYEAKDVAPLFPFGFGLSYTQFAYDNLRLSKESWQPGRGQVANSARNNIFPCEVRADITNTGARAGQEVVQLYVRQIAPRLARPPKELKAFAKVALAPGETATVAFTLDEEAFAFYDPARKAWTAEAGAYQVLVGSSSADIRLVGELTL